MANVLGYMPNLKKLVGLDSSTRAVNVPAVEVHRVETDPDRRARCLKHLLKANHINYSIIRRSEDSERTVSNNMPHALSSAYFLGATVPQLNDTYDQEIKPLGPWHPSPAELDEDWLDVKGDERYARAYVDFFEDKLAIEFAYDWKKVVLHFLFAGQEPLFHGLIGNEGSALIRLAYAFELDSKELGMEGLGQAAVHYSPLHKYMNDSAYTRPSPLAKGTVEELLGHMKNDERFQRLQLQSASFGGLSKDQEELLLEYWNAWDLEDPTAQFEISQKATVSAILTLNRPKQNTFDPGLAQILITSHAVRTLLPFIPSEFHVPLLRQWWLLTVAIVIQRGGLQQSEYGVVIDTAGKDWKYIQHKVVESLLPKDVLGVQVVQAIQETASTYGDNRSQSLAAAVTFVDNFKDWST